jgi:HK97 family phage major capsid protein
VFPRAFGHSKEFHMPATKREQLEKLVHDMQSLADAADVKGDFSAEDRQKVIDMMADSKRLADEIKDEATINGGLSDAKNFLAALAAPPGGNGTNGEKHDLTVSGLPMNPPGGKTIGEMFTESPAYGDFKARYAGADGIIKPSTKGIQSGQFTADLKTLLTGGSATSAGAVVANDRYAPITDLIGERELTVDDLISKGTTGSDTIEYVRITGKTNSASGVPEASAASGTSGTKPESALAFEVVSTTVKTIAHWIPITKRAASDAPQVRSLVDTFLRYGLEEKLEDQELNGAGTSEDFEGINTAVTQNVGSTGTDIDAIVDGIKTVRVTGRRKPTAVVFHPNDWYSTNFLLAKTGDGTNSAANYLIGDPRASVDQLNQLWGLKVVVSEAQTENTALVGDFRWAMRWAREGISITMSDSHSDFFVRNLLAILGERRDAFGVLDVQSFCKVTGV